MSALKVDTQNINIQANKIADFMIDNKHYDQYNNEVIEKITFEVIDKLTESFDLNINANEVIFDDEELFDATYDYMLKKLNEVFSTADIAYIVNDVFMQLEDVLFDEGLIEYTN